MKTINMKAILAIAFLTLSQPALAWESSDSDNLLREALMSSNADYNKLKEKTNIESFERDQSWSERGTATIEIGKQFTNERHNIHPEQEQNEVN